MTPTAQTLVRAIDQRARERNRHPILDAPLIAQELEGWDRDYWVGIALLSAQRPPNRTVRGEILDFYERRFRDNLGALN